MGWGVWLGFEWCCWECHQSTCRCWNPSLPQHHLQKQPITIETESHSVLPLKTALQMRQNITELSLFKHHCKWVKISQSFYANETKSHTVLPLKTSLEMRQNITQILIHHCKWDKIWHCFTIENITANETKSQCFTIENINSNETKYHTAFTIENITAKEALKTVLYIT